MRTGQLRRLENTELVLGAVLPGHVRDQDGRILIEGGQVLEERHIALLRQRGNPDLYAGKDWPGAGSRPADPPADPREIVEALRRRPAPEGRLKPRRHQRHHCATKVRLLVEERSPEGCRQRELEATTCDVSASGFAFVFDQFIHPGTTLRATFDGLPGRPYLTAVVRYCVHLSARKHRIGAQFTTSAPAKP